MSHVFAQPADAVRSGSDRIRDWPLWQLPPIAAAYCVVVIALPLAILPLTIWRDNTGLRLADLAGLSLLGFCAVASIEGARWVGLPAMVRGRPYHDLFAVWVLAMALVLPPPYLVIGASVLTPMLVRGSGHGLYRRLFYGSRFALSALAARAMADLVLGGRTPVAALESVGSARAAAGLVAALLAYELVSGALVTGAVLLVQFGRPAPGTFGRLATLVTDLAGLSVGLLVVLAWTVAPVLAVAAVLPVILLQRALIHDELREAAQTDAKTGVGSAGHWTELARRCTDRAAAARTSCAVILLDVDRFKRLNDSWGHLAGDAVLAEVGRLLRLGVRPSDAVGRLGGEEFGVLLPDTAMAAAADVAERLRARIAGHEVPVSTADGATVLRVTVSAGVASTAESGYRIRDLLAAADAGLYAAKAAGRNQVVAGSGRLDEPPDPAAPPALSAPPVLHVPVSTQPPDSRFPSLTTSLGSRRAASSARNARSSRRARS